VTVPYPRDEFPPELRTYRCDGTHALTHERDLTFSGADGAEINLLIVYCADETCAAIVRTRCLHASNSWKYVPGYAPEDNPPDGIETDNTSALLCDFCGKDGT
jgi:hypothetical protein